MKNENDESVLVSAAKAIGEAAGTVASLVGVKAEAAPAQKKAKAGKLPPKNKQRLPRKEKKTQKKLAAAKKA